MMHRVFAALSLILVLASGGAATGQAGQAPAPDPAAAAQQPPITFRAEVNYVEVDARVLDQQGAFVPSLKAGDFQVLEDGKPQQVSIFSLVNIPVERAERPLFASKPIEPDTRTNFDGASGRIYLLLLDDLHTNFQRSPRVRATVRQFVERYMGANDTAAVVFTSGRTDASQDFTNNPRLLLRAVDKFMGRKVRSATLNRIDEEARTRDTRQQGDKIDDMDDKERGYQARTALDTIKNLAEYLGGISGRRKALVLFSEGIDYDINDVFNNQDASTIMESTRDLIASATRANVAVYGVDPRGLTMGEDSVEVQAFPDDTSLGISQTSLYNEVRLGQDSLRVLSDETGGFAVVNRNDFATAFQRIVEDNSSYYVLGYYSSNEKRDGRFRKIDVRLNNRQGLSVRARKGYVAARGKAPETKLSPNAASTELRDALASPLPLAGIPLAMTAVAFKGPAPKGSVIVSTLIHGGGLPLMEKDGTFRNDLEVQVVATDDKGKSFPTDRNTVNLAMKPETANRVKGTGFRFISTLDLAPGRYQLRVAVREGNTKKAGSVTFDLDVPDFSKEPLSMSGLAITSALSSSVPTARPKDPLEKLLPGPLSSYREFPTIDEIAFFAEVYDLSASKPHKVDLAASVKAEGGQTVYETKEQRDSTELAGSAGGYGFSARIPLKGLAPGLYVLRVEATSRLGDGPSVARESVFRVLPVPAQR